VLLEKPVVDVNLHTVERIEAILREADGPVSRNYILQKLKESGGGTNSPRLNRALQYLYDHRMIVEGSKGVQWTRSDSSRIRRAVALGKRL
jgi:hypothetical protein